MKGGAGRECAATESDIKSVGGIAGVVNDVLKVDGAGLRGGGLRYDIVHTAIIVGGRAIVRDHHAKGGGDGKGNGISRHRPDDRA